MASLSKQWRQGRDIILYVEKIPSGTIESIKDFGKRHRRRFKIGLIYDSRSKKSARYAEKMKEKVDVLIPCDFSKSKRIVKRIKPYEDKLLAITCRSEANLQKFAKIIPHVPYLRTPSAESIKWSINKLEMRRRFTAYDKTITPKYTVVKSAGKSDLKKIKKKIGFPLVVKPAGLAQSMLVTVCYHNEELEKALKKTFRKIRSVYKERESKEDPVVLVEQFIEGDMYSIDSYVDTRGRVTHCPAVHIKTGQNIGIDDFFGYRQMTPTTLSKKAVKEVEEIAEKSIRALGLRSTTAHIEVIRSDEGWKVVEVGARVGGFRQALYSMSYGFNHGLNDMLVRVPDKVSVSKAVKGHSVAMKFFAPKEGRLVKFTGLKKTKALKSFKSIHISKKKGDQCKFAKNGGSSVFNIIMFNKDRSDLLADIRRLEGYIKIETKRA